MLTWAVKEGTGPVAIRYPRGGEGTYRGGYDGADHVVLRRGKDLTMVTHGATVDAVLAAAEALEGEGISATVVKLNNLTPLDWSGLCALVADTGRLLAAEECVQTGSAGERLAAQLAMGGVSPRSVTLCNVGDRFITQGSVGELRRLCGLDAQSLVDAARKAVIAQ